MKTKCPKCPSSDAYHIYDYGLPTEHGHCFSCGHHQHPQSLEQLKSQVDEINAQNAKHMREMFSDLSSPLELTLPFGCTKTIPSQALQWLDKYGIIREEIIDYDIQWCEGRNMLVFPIRKPVMDKMGNPEYKSGKLLAYISRSFSVEFDGISGMYSHLRWTTKGPIQADIHTFGRAEGNPKKASVVLVEDIVSAIKVARQTRCMPLFGANVSPKRLVWLNANTNNVVLWLDQNKWKEALTFAKSCELIGLNTKVVYSDKDPKSYTDSEIKQFITL